MYEKNSFVQKKIKKNTIFSKKNEKRSEILQLHFNFL